MAYLWTWLSDLRLPDGTLLPSGENLEFTKAWRIRNSGDTDWVGFTLEAHPQTDLFKPLKVDVKNTPRGAEVVVSIELEAPTEPGEFDWYFQLKDDEGNVVPSSAGGDFLYTLLRFSEPDSIVPSWQDNRQLTRLRGYGVALSDDHPQGGDWSAGEIDPVWSVISSAGQTSLNAFLQKYDIDEPDPTLAFQAIFGPQLVFRWRREHAHLEKKWWAQKPDGFTMILANKTFFAGKRQTFIHFALGSPLQFNSTQLIAHEIAHALTWQYSDVTSDYVNVFETQDGLARDDGLTFGARSSSVDENNQRTDQPWEITADALANFLMAALKLDADGQQRQVHMQALFETLITHRLNQYNSEAVRDKIKRVRTTRNSHSVLLSLVDFGRIDTWLEGLRPKNG